MLKGKFIGVTENKNTFVLECEFSTDNTASAVLKITALGLYYAEINGVRVGDSYLTPGWTSYNKMLQVQEYDISTLLHKGKNCIALTVSEGWYAGPVTWMKKRNVYGDKIAVCADIIIGDKVISTDESWTAHTSPIQSAGIYDGEKVDYTAMSESLTAMNVPFNKKALVNQIGECVKTIEKIAVQEVIKTPSGDIVYDFGQNFAGVVQITTPEDFKGTITMKFGEILVDGEFYTANLGAAKATDSLTGKGKITYAPEFTYHGFRYMKLEGAFLPKENIVGLVRHSDMKRTGEITVSNSRLQKLLSNIVWSQRGNFVDIPSDCPQRAERLGWTGDINAFCTTAAFNYDIRKFMKKWLADCRNDQEKTGELPVVIPYVLEGVSPVSTVNTSAMWSDCIVTVPYKLFCMYGDKSFLSDNYDSMKRFLAARERSMKDGLIASGFEFGDWLSMDVDALKTHPEFGNTDKYFIANMLHLNVLDIMAKIAVALGKPTDEKKYAQQYKRLYTAVRKEYFTPNGRLACDTVTAYTLALHFQIVPEEQISKVAALLDAKVKGHNYTVVTGFIGTPYLLFALADNGYPETAYKVLMNSGFPGWLYEVDMGATTIWERWNALTADGKPNSDGMNSYNHYAYGSVMEFIYRRTCGIEPVSAGFKCVKIAPVPGKGIANIKARYESVNGTIEAGYRQKDGKIEFFAQVPDDVVAEVYLPNEGKVAEGSGRFSFVSEWENLEIAQFNLDTNFTKIYSSPKAMKAFESTFAGVFHPAEIEYLKSSSETLQLARQYLKDKGKMTEQEFMKRLDQMNEMFI